MKYLKNRDKQTRFSMRKYSVGVFSVSVATLYFLAGGNALAADNNVPRVSETSNGTTGNPDADPKVAENKDNTKPKEDKNVQTGDKNEPKEDKNVQTGANTEPESNKESLNTTQPTEESTSANTRAPRKRRAIEGNPSTEEPDTTVTDEAQPTSSENGKKNETVIDPKRKGEIVKTDQPGVRVPKDGEKGSDDKNANLTFDTPGENATVEEMWKIIQNMPDDFQNNERSYLRNMNTLGDDLRFDKTEANPEGVPLQPGEIRELHDFGGWHAITKDGKQGVFAIGKKNAQGYFTGWYKDENGKRQEGGMLGSNALDQIYVHEQALDRRFKYMLMLAKGRTRANRTDTVQDGTPYDPKTPNNRANQGHLNSLPVNEKDDILQHSPNIVGFNGIEKEFAAFSTAYGSRLRVEFVTGYISDYEGSKGTYKVVITAKKSDGSSKEIYSHTINRIDGVIDNEELYRRGVDTNAINNKLKKYLKQEFTYKINTEINPILNKELPLPPKLKPLSSEDKKDPQKLAEWKAKEEENQKEIEETKKARDARKEELTAEIMPKYKDIVWNITEHDLSEAEIKKNFKTGYATFSNEFNNIVKLENNKPANSPSWAKTSEKNEEGIDKAKDPNRLYKLWKYIMPTAKKITYHADTDQLEIETGTYSYLEARNGQEEKILGSHMEASEKPPTTEMTEADYDRYRTNELAAAQGAEGRQKFTAHFVEKDRVNRPEDKVIDDKTLSSKIEEKLGKGDSKLGKGGYFSTGDIPLEKDVVSYTIQVFSENKKRVGVNFQSPRLQYNLPILADFSVIQDTVEPSKEVARRIIKKQREDGKITEEQEKKITDEIDKKKKTSEVRKAISGNVKVRYVNENGEDIALSEEVAKKIGEKAEDGTYLVEKEKLIGTDYNLTDKKLGGISSGDKKYRLKRSLNNGLYNDSAPITGEVSSTDTVVKFVYEEGEATKAKAVVHVKKQQAGGTTVELDKHKLNLETEVGEEFSSESFIRIYRKQSKRATRVRIRNCQQYLYRWNS